jgi:hypothetical protein
VTDGRWTVDFRLGPACPLTRNTAGWIVSVARQLPVDVRWRVMSLSVLNEHRDEDREGDAGYLQIPARVATAVQVTHGQAAPGAFNDALWTDADGTHQECIGDIAAALVRCGLPHALAGIGHTTDYDSALRRSQRDGVGPLSG